MSKRLAETNSALIHQVSDNIAEQIATHAADDDAHHDVIELDDLDKYVPPIIINYADGFERSYYRWRCAQNDTEAYIYFNFICPQTRADWKVVLIYNNQYNNNDQSGLLRVAAIADDEPWDDNNLINDANFDLVVATEDDEYHKESAAFSATVGDKIAVRWRKDANNGGAGEYIYILGAYLTHA